MVLGSGALLLAGVALTAVALGTTGVGPGDAFAIVAHRLFGIGSVSWPAASETIVWELRVPRVLAGMVVGAGLGCAGAVFQALLRNPLADPYIIGTAAGASFGAVAALLLPAALLLLLLTAIGVVAALLTATAVLGIVTLVRHESLLVAR